MEWSAEVVAKVGNRIERWDQSIGFGFANESAVLNITLPPDVFPSLLAEGHFASVYLNLFGRDLNGRVVQRNQLPPMNLGVVPTTGLRVLWDEPELMSETEHGTFAELDEDTLASLAALGPNVRVRPHIEAEFEIAEDQDHVERRILDNPQDESPNADGGAQ